jgi:MFS family permease
MCSEKFRSTARLTLANIALVTNAFVWYYFVVDILQNILRIMPIDQFTTLLIWSAHFAGITFSAIAGASLVRRIKGRTRFLILWMMLGIASSLISIAVDITSISNVLMLSILLGVSLGLGMPCCMGYFTESIETDNRSRVGGIILLLSGVGVVVLGTVTTGNISLQTSVLSAWRIFGLLFYVLFRPVEKKMERNEVSSYRALFNQRSFFLYLIPWVMFSLVTYLTVPMQSKIVGSPANLEFLRVIENVLGAVFAVIGGFLSDAIGRKSVAIAGVALLGLGYSALGIYPQNPLSWYFYTICDGVAWGMLLVIFVITIWGDLSHDKPSDVYYAIGVLPFFISKFLQLTIATYVTATIPNYAIFSFTALFLFLAVIPLMYAPETLPEKLVKQRELKGYIEKAKKEKEKYS